jgi:glycerophosphoryl diester phosphodiesterase
MATQLIQGHRGYNTLYPENTMLSFREAVKAGVNAIECDVKMTADGVLIISHDSTLDRTTNGTGDITQLTWEYISTLDAGEWKGAEFANREDTKVPRFDDVLLEFKGQPIFIVVHCLVYGNDKMQAIVNKVREYDMVNQVHFSIGAPGDINSLNYIKTNNPDVWTQSSGMADFTAYDAMLQNAIAYGHNAVSISASETTANLTTMINTIHTAGKVAHISVVNWANKTRTQEYIDLGADFILGDDVTEMMAVFNSNGLTQITPTFSQPPIEEPIEIPASELVKNVQVFIKPNAEWLVPERVFTKTNGEWIEIFSTISAR